MISVSLLGCLGRGEVLPSDIMLDSNEIPGDWEITNENFVNRTWDRQGGYRNMVRTFEWKGAVMTIQIEVYGFPSRAEDSFPTVEPPAGTVPSEVQLGEEGLYWSSMPDEHAFHFRDGGVVVYSKLSNSDQARLGIGLFFDIMNSIQSKIPARA